MRPQRVPSDELRGSTPDRSRSLAGQDPTSVAGNPAGDGVGPGTRGTILSWRRLLVCLGVGLLAAAATVLAGIPEIAALVGCAAAAAALLVWAWRISWPQDAPGTKRLAEEEGRTRLTDGLVLGAAVASLAAVVVALVRAGSDDASGVSTVVICVVLVVLSWAVVNTVFALKFARHYYSGGDGGIEFDSSEPPAYSDFAYMAFTIGMSFALPDVSVADREGRKLVLGHALMSYLFGTVVVAVAINLVTNLGQS